MGTGKWQSREKRYKPDDVIVVGDRPALITRVGGDGTTGDRDTIDYCFINSDGTLSPGHYFRGDYDVPEGTKHIDFAKVETIVTLPPEWKERAVAYETKKKEDDAKHRAERGEWEPETHPAYGACRVSRVSGHTALFGSPFKHQHYMTLTVARAEKYRGLASDRIHGGIRGDLMEIAFSEAQWARLLSSVGQGEGVPCTLQRVGGRAVEPCPEQAEVERFHADIEKDAKQSAAFLNETLELARALLDDKAPTKEKRKMLLEKLTFAKKQMDDSMPFVTKQLRERMDTVVQESKTEIEAFAQRTLIDAGLQKLAEVNAGASAVLTLPEDMAKPPKLIEGEVTKKGSKS